jgi:hypothetical protein
MLSLKTRIYIWLNERVVGKGSKKKSQLTHVIYKANLETKKAEQPSPLFFQSISLLWTTGVTKCS